MDINLIRKLGIYLMLCKNILCSFNNTYSSIKKFVYEEK